MRACHQTLADHQTGISIGMALHTTPLTQNQRSPLRISLCRLSFLIACHQAVTTSAFPTGVAWIDPAGDDALVPCLILGVREDAPLHPEGSLAVAPTAVRASLGFEMAEVLKHQDSSPVVVSKLDNASTHQVCERLIDVLDLAPEVDIVLFAIGEDASLAAVACNPSKLLLPKAVYLLATPDECGGKTRTFNSLDGADREVVVEIEIDRTYGCLRVSCDLLFNVAGRAKRFSMGVCNHHCLPCLTSEGLPTSPSEGNSRPVMRTLSQDQQVPVQTLSRMLDGVRSFH